MALCCSSSSAAAPKPCTLFFLRCFLLLVLCLATLMSVSAKGFDGTTHENAEEQQRTSSSSTMDGNPGHDHVARSSTIHDNTEDAQQHHNTEDAQQHHNTEDAAFSFRYIASQVCWFYTNLYLLHGHTPPPTRPPPHDPTFSSIRITVTNNLTEGIVVIFASNGSVKHWQVLLPGASTPHPYHLANSEHDYDSRLWDLYVCERIRVAHHDPTHGFACDFVGATAEWKIALDKFTIKRVPHLDSIPDDEIRNPWLKPSLLAH